MRRFAQRVPDWLARSWVPGGILLLGVLLASPSLSVGLALDDYIHLARLEPETGVGGLEYAPLDLFSFVSGEATGRQALLEEGFLPWWSAPDLRVAFWRPLSALTHLLDHVLWPRSVLLAHVHSLLWFLALLVVLVKLYRRLHAPWVAHLALLLYAVDDARGQVLGWIAHRNALVAATLGFAALLFHDRARRDGWRAGAWLAPALFGAALLGGESALAVTAYLCAHALFVDQGSVARRLVRLWPYAGLSLVWLTAYGALGYGGRGGALYVDPGDGLVSYLRLVMERVPVYLAAQLGLGSADVWMQIPPPARLVLYGLSLATLAAVALALGPVARRQSIVRFWALGAALSLAPMCATFPSDRLLTFAGVGAMAVVAMLMAAALEEEGKLGRLTRLSRRVVVPLLALAHLVIAPLLLPVRTLTMNLASDFVGRVDSSIPSGEDVRSRTLVIVNAPVDFLMLWYVPVRRAILHVPRPRGVRLLTAGLAEVRVSRVDAQTLRVFPGEDFLSVEPQRVMRAASRPFRPGEAVALSDVSVHVGAVTADGRPSQFDVGFGVPLEDPSLLWLQWRGGALAPYTPPPVGESHVLPPIDPMAVMTGQPRAPSDRGAP